MDSSIELQKKIRENAEDLRRFVSDLSSWEEEMKQKDSEAKTATLGGNAVPPIRNSCKKRDNAGSSGTSTTEERHSVKKRISSADYGAWEKFDVEKACEEVDKPHKAQKTEQDGQVMEKRLRDEANVEKEKGNLFVKKEKWDSAIQCYSKAIKCYSRDPTFYCNRALCYLKKKDYRAAETDCTSAIALDNTYVKAFHRRGLARKQLNQIEEAATDLLHASEIEPNNSVIMKDYSAVKVALGKPVSNTILPQAATTKAKAETVSNLCKKEKPDPALHLNKQQSSTCTPKMLASEKESRCLPAWPKLSDCAVIEPVHIPPHKRSKKPLQRIQIQEDNDIATASTKGEADLPVQSASDTCAGHEASKNCLDAKGKEDSVSLDDNGRESLQASTSTSTRENLPESSVSSINLRVPSKSVPENLPTSPKNSVQFLAAWRQISKDSNMCHQYLKQINGEHFPKIFQDSLDGNILSEILTTLAKTFIPAHAPVLNYLRGITEVRRFRTLTLFLSPPDKENLEALFKHTQRLEETSPEVIDSLRKAYEL